MMHHYTNPKMVIIKDRQEQVQVRVSRNGNPCLIGGIVNGVGTLESSLEVPPKVKHRVTILRSSATPRSCFGRGLALYQGLLIWFCMWVTAQGQETNRVGNSCD